MKLISFVLFLSLFSGLCFAEETNMTKMNGLLTKAKELTKNYTDSCKSPSVCNEAIHQEAIKTTSVAFQEFYSGISTNPKAKPGTSYPASIGDELTELNKILGVTDCPAVVDDARATKDSASGTSGTTGGPATATGN